MPHRLASLDYAILGLLARGPATGYDLRRVFQTTALGRYSDSPGSIYPAIRRLRASRLVLGRAEAGGRKRTVLRLTAAGHAALVEWVSAPVTPEQFFRDSAAVDLRLAFVSDAAPGRLSAFTEGYRRAAEGYVDRLEAARDDFENEISVSAAMAFDIGLHLARARVSWAHASRTRGAVA